MKKSNISYSIWVDPECWGIGITFYKNDESNDFCYSIDVQFLCVDFYIRFKRR